MGSSAKEKVSGRPRRVLESGEAGSGTSGSGGPRKRSGLRVPLVRLDRRVHAVSSLDEAVTVVVAAELEVHTRNGRLGNIPPQFKKAVEDSGFTGGSVVELGEDPLVAVVFLS